MATTLIAYDTAKAHLKLPDDTEQDDVMRKVASATAIVLKHINREDNDWTETTDATSDLDFAIVQAAILEVLGDLYHFRGDDPGLPTEAASEGAWLRANVRRKLHPLRRPTYACDGGPASVAGCDRDLCLPGADVDADRRRGRP